MEEILDCEILIKNGYRNNVESLYCMFRTLAPNLPWLGSQEYRAQSSRAISELGMLVRFATRILSMLKQQRQFFRFLRYLESREGLILVG